MTFDLCSQFPISWLYNTGPLSGTLSRDLRHGNASLQFSEAKSDCDFLCNTTVRVSFLPYDRTSAPLRFGGLGVKGPEFNNVYSLVGLLNMDTLSKSLLLFAMNWLDAQLTILWVRLQVATEGNGLMAALLNLGEAPFLSVKLAVGAFAAYIFYRYAEMPLAKKGITLVMGIYCALLGLHVVTGFSALGWHAPATILAYFGSLPGAIWALLS